MAERGGALERAALLIEAHIRNYLVRGREDYAHTGQDGVVALVDRQARHAAVSAARSAPRVRDEGAS